MWGVAHNDAEWLAVGDAGVVLTSTDGVSWERHQVGITSLGRMPTWTGSRWLVLAGEGVWSSVDGREWTLVGPTPVTPVGLAARPAA